MTSFFYDHDLTALMEHFYTLTGIRIALFDSEFHEILSYPAGGNTFCSLLRTNPAFDELCKESDRVAFETCRKTQALSVYRCHAGLIEATAPLIQNNAIIGYIMFGQITDNKDKDAVRDFADSLCQKYLLSGVMPDKAKRIKYKSEKQILATSKILDACTSYIMLKEMIRPKKEPIMDLLSQYVETHLADSLSVDEICAAIAISRTRLYEETKQYTGGGVASYVKGKRLDKAKLLVTDTVMPITEISDAVGFSDYNYFLRVFKKRYGISPKRMRNHHIHK